jgi:GAF domain-containing protein
MQPSRDIQTMRLETKQVLQQLLGMIEPSFMHEIQLQALAEMIRLTKSQVGFLFLVDEDASEIRIRLISTADETAYPLFSTSAIDLNLQGCWRTCVDRREPVVSNQPTLSPMLVDDDLGPLIRSVILPVIVKDKIVAVIGVGNRELPYEPFDAEVLNELATGLWRVVARKKLHDIIPDDMK